MKRLKYACWFVAAASIGLCVLSALSCQSSKPTSGISAGGFTSEVWGCINHARELLDAVGAPRRDVFPYTVFSFAEGTYYGVVPCTNIRGYGIHPGSFDFKAGKQQLLPLRDGQPQLDIWTTAIMHRWLNGTEQSDYHWMNLATGACLPE